MKEQRIQAIEAASDPVLVGYHATIANSRWPMPLPPTPVPWLQVMTNRIIEQFDPLKIILFGSHARGEATADSDIDLLVVFPELTNKRETTIAIRSILADLSIAKDIVVTTPAEIAEYGDLVGPILRPALQEGKVIYERDA